MQSHHLSTSLALVCLVVLGFAIPALAVEIVPAAASAEGLSAEEWRQVDKGETVVRSEKAGPVEQWPSQQSALLGARLLEP